MTTKLTLLALCALPLFAAHQVLEKPGDNVKTCTDNAITYTMLPTSSSMLASLTPQEAARQAGLIFITKQEAQDVIGALEMLESSSIVLAEKTIQQCKDGKMCQKSAEHECDLYERNRLWARAVLETWKNKMEAFK